MKHYNHIFPKYFYSCVNETKCIRLINLSSKENRYAYNINCKILFKNVFFFNKIQSLKLKLKTNFKNFITQYFNIK